MCRRFRSGLRPTSGSDISRFRRSQNKPLERKSAGVCFSRIGVTRDQHFTRRHRVLYIVHTRRYTYDINITAWYYFIAGWVNNIIHRHAAFAKMTRRRRLSRVVFIRTRFLVSSVRCSSSGTPGNGPKIGRNWVSTLWQQRRRRKREKIAVSSPNNSRKKTHSAGSGGGGRVFVVNARPTDTSCTYIYIYVVCTIRRPPPLPTPRVRLSPLIYRFVGRNYWTVICTNVHKCNISQRCVFFLYNKVVALCREMCLTLCLELRRNEKKCRTYI